MRRGGRAARASAGTSIPDFGYLEDVGHPVRTLPWTKSASPIAEVTTEGAVYVPRAFPATDGSEYNYLMFLKRETTDANGDGNTLWCMRSIDGTSWSDYNSRSQVLDGTTFGGAASGPTNAEVHVDSGVIYAWIDHNSGVALASIAEDAFDASTPVVPADWTNISSAVIPSSSFTAAGLSSPLPSRVIIDANGHYHILGGAIRTSDSAAVSWHAKGTSRSDLNSIQDVEVFLESGTYGSGPAELAELDYTHNPDLFRWGGVDWLSYGAKTAALDDLGSTEGYVDIHLATVTNREADSWVGNVTKDLAGRRFIARGGTADAAGAGLRGGYDESRIYTSRMMLAQSGNYDTPLVVGTDVLYFTSVRPAGQGVAETGLASIDQVDFMASWQDTYPYFFARYAFEEGAGAPQDSGPHGHHMTLGEGVWQSSPTSISVAYSTSNPPAFPGWHATSALSHWDLRTVAGWWYYDPSEERRVFAWVQNNAAGSTSAILEKPASLDVIRLRFRSITIDSPSLAEGWHHFAWTYDGPTETPTFYVDGTAYTDATISRSDSPMVERSYGGFGLSTDRGWDDRFAGKSEMWLERKSAAYIAALYAEGPPA